MNFTFRWSRKRLSPGYSFVELMVVVAIISLLAAVGVPNLLEAEMRARNARTRADMQTIATAMSMYAADNHGLFPPAPAQPDISPMWQGPQQFRDNAGYGLTTPIAYLVTIPMSVFHRDPDPRVPGAGYYLFNYKFHSHRNQTVAADEKCPFADLALAAGAEYVIWSIGPNKGDPASSDGTVYDPTNGNVSRGRIAYFSDRRLYHSIYDVRP